MSSILKSLQPWTAELSLIHPNCWPLLGKLLPKLGSALFRPAATADDVQQPPDGFDGVSNRGNLSRLLPTEWGLLDAYSDEFYRRLAMGESQYLKPGYEKQQQPQAFYVLLDRGPDQYGAPFLIQFALLLVLARRAREVKRSLHVGFIQTPDKWIIATPQNLQHNIHPHRSHARVLPAMIEAWQTAIESTVVESTVDTQALWTATSSRQSEAVTFGQQLIIDTDATISDTSLSPTFSVLFKPRQQRLHFHLPAENEAVHLLRNPFKTQSALVTPPPSTTVALKQFQLHPTARVCFFYTSHELLGIRIPKQMQANCKRLKSYKQPIKHQLVGVWHRKGQMAIVQVDEHAIYCTGFFQQAKITIPLDALSTSFVSPQITGVVPLAYTARRNEKAVIIIKDGDSQGFALHFQKKGASTAGNKRKGDFAFKGAIALGSIHHERIVEQSFFYTDGNQTLYEITLEDNQDSTREHHTHPPHKLSCDHHISGLIQRYGSVDGRYISAYPLMKDEGGSWIDSLREEYAILPDDEPIGGSSSFMLVKRSDREIWQLPRDFSSPKKALGVESKPETCLIEESEPIVHAVHQDRNQWIVYQTASRFKVYSLKDSAEMMNMELAHYAK